MTVQERRNFTVIIQITASVPYTVFARTSEEAEQLAEDALESDLQGTDGLTVTSDMVTDDFVEDVFPEDPESDATGTF
jgi:hypothetical protein